ncbi:hypothetical protein E1B28_012334 [Marasmius oreades]|uniref:Uncharacterized protein n=1 Tax=Marasmius oreades TaxID=181124 RepID=A0A9P7UNU5_9AGAR|nr:uncharacterized protein E1B28_012334 [Marasmius oreades]KAG7088325.1 hypothetical protein E1B28_012334 [Marasmius oreades]
MYFIKAATLFFLPLLSVVVAAPSTRRAPPSPGSGVIVKPAGSTVIAPGQSFDFLYDTRADYGVSSYNFNVYLFTSRPSGFVVDEDYATGHYYGRWALPNYPGNPSPSNLPPAQLVMPDFSKNPGGFGAGASASNQTVYLAVLEEYATGTGSVGLRMSLALTELIYNGTSSN